MTPVLELSLVLPAYLEEENLRLLLPRLKTVLDGVGIAYEILVVDTQTPLDRTKEACEPLGVRYFNREGGNFYGDAVRTGVKHAQGKYIAFMDADGSHGPEFLPTLLKEREANDVVIASRYVEGGFTENPPMLILLSKILNVTYSVFLNLKCKDVSNSFKLYRAELLKKLDLHCSNFDIIEEILFKLQRFNPGLRIKEVPFTFKKRMFGETKRNLLVFMLTYLVTMIRLRLSVYKTRS